MTAQVEALRALSETVSDNIAAEAARRRMSHSRLAVALGMSRSAVQGRFGGRTPWTLDEVQQAAHLFGVRPADLLVELPRLDSNQQPIDYRPATHLSVVAA